MEPDNLKQQTGMVARYLELLDAQREDLFAWLGAVPADQVWQRIEPRKWSMGEHVDHARLLLRSGRRLLQVVWPPMKPLGYWRRNRPYETTIDDVYERPGFPNSLGWLWTPKHGPSKPVSVEQLHAEVAAEHQRVRRWYVGRDEAVLGNINLYDPPIGWLNLVQALRVATYHDAHHFRIAEGIRDRL